MTDPYLKLKPRQPTPLEERCDCEPLTSLYLAHTLSDNPIHCGACRGEVAPEKIGIDVATTEIIARWNTVYGAVYALWLDSGAYEQWAEAELRDRGSDVNRSGLTAQQALSRYISTSYLWFWNETRPESCPACGSDKLSKRGAMLICEPCGVSV